MEIHSRFLWKGKESAVFFQPAHGNMSIYGAAGGQGCFIVTHLRIVGAEEVAFVPGTGAEMEEGAGYPEHNLREVLGTHGSRYLRHILLTYQFPDIAQQLGCNPGIILGGSHLSGPFNVRMAAEGGADAVDNLHKAALGVFPYLLVEGADGAGEVAPLRNDIAGVAGNDLSDGEDQRLLLVAFPAVEGLQGQMDMGDDVDGVDALFRSGAMRALAMDSYLESICRSGIGAVRIVST